jgi:hypothetical protein
MVYIVTYYLKRRGYSKSRSQYIEWCTLFWHVTSTNTHVLPRVAAKKRAVIHRVINVAVLTAVWRSCSIMNSSDNFCISESIYECKYKDWIDILWFSFGYEKQLESKYAWSPSGFTHFKQPKCFPHPNENHQILIQSLSVDPDQTTQKNVRTVKNEKFSKILFTFTEQQRTSF